MRRLEALLYLTKFEYNVPISLSDFVIEDLKWWADILSDPKLCRTSFDLILKHPSDGDYRLFTDASGKWGGGGYVTDKDNKIIFKFQIDWFDTILMRVRETRPIDIEMLELLMSIVGVTLMLPHLKNKSITIYNDNPIAAGAIRTKAPRLYRLDLQFLIRRLATMAAKSKFYFWGIHYTVKDGIEMQLADDLSRFQARARYHTRHVPELNGYAIVNELLAKLEKHPLNLQKKVDIPEEARREYSLLLNDDKFNYNHPKIVDLIAKQKQYNILNN